MAGPERARDAAQRRERKARERARAGEERGLPSIARLHRKSAELQADAAADAKTLLELDEEIEGVKSDR